MTDGSVTTAAQAMFTVIGTNDAPVVAGTLTVAATEDAPVAAIDGLAQASDIDHGAVLSITAARAAADGREQVSGPYYGGLRIIKSNGGTNSAVHPPPAMPRPCRRVSISRRCRPPRHLRLRDQQLQPRYDPVPPTSACRLAGLQDRHHHYGVTDGIATVAARAVFTVTGVNDARLLSGPRFCHRGSGRLDRPTHWHEIPANVDAGLDVGSVVSATGKGRRAAHHSGRLLPARHLVVTAFNPGARVLQAWLG